MAGKSLVSSAFSILLYELYHYSSILVLVDIRYLSVFKFVSNSNDAVMTVSVPRNGIAGL